MWPTACITAEPAGPFRSAGHVRQDLLFHFFFMWVRWTVPRFRYDQLMSLGWKAMIPLSLFNMFVTGFIILWRQTHGH